MSNDSTKVKGSTKNENIFRENCKKEELLRVNWPYDWQWCVDLFREREKVVDDYKKSSPKALALQAHEKPDLRTVRPFPETSARYCGWLSGRNEFQLEVYGPCYLSPKVTLNPPEQT